MDWIEEALTNLASAEERAESGFYTSAKVDAMAAIAHALIAICERLDRIIDTDYHDSGQAVLMIGSPFKLYKRDG